jgi:hypothetical protein
VSIRLPTATIQKGTEHLLYLKGNTREGLNQIYTSF